jgi:hypothetical protein
MELYLLYVSYARLEPTLLENRQSIVLSSSISPWTQCLEPTALDVFIHLCMGFGAH